MKMIIKTLLKKASNFYTVNANIKIQKNSNIKILNYVYIFDLLTEKINYFLTNQYVNIRFHL